MSTLPLVGGQHGCGNWIQYGGEVEVRGPYHDDVGLQAGGEGADLVLQPDRPGALDGGEFEHVP